MTRAGQREPLGVRASGILIALSSVVVAILLALSLGAPALAHVAIRLDIVSPQNGERVEGSPILRIAAAQTLGGVEGTTFAVRVDGRAIDPVTGRAVPKLRFVPIGANETVDVPLRDLSSGTHVAAIRYRPDEDEAPVEKKVSFIVAAGDDPGPILPLALAGVAVVALAAAGWLRSHRG